MQNLEKFSAMPPRCGHPPVQRERVLTVRVTFDELDQLKRAARSQGTTVSELLRSRLNGKK